MSRNGCEVIFPTKFRERRPMSRARRYAVAAAFMFWLGLMLGFGLDHLLFVR